MSELAGIRLDTRSPKGLYVNLHRARRAVGVADNTIETRTSATNERIPTIPHEVRKLEKSRWIVKFSKPKGFPVFVSGS